MRKPSIKTFALSALCLLVAACAGRTPNPVEVSQPTDGLLSCPLILAEISGNTSRARTLLRQQDDADSDNAALAVTGALLFWPALFFMDLSEADKIEMEALQDRNKYLGTLATQKSCEFDLPTTVEEADQRDLKKRIEEAESSGAPPKCVDVGGYETYMEKTGRVCQL